MSDKPHIHSEAGGEGPRPTTVANARETVPPTLTEPLHPTGAPGSGRDGPNPAAIGDTTGVSGAELPRIPDGEGPEANGPLRTGSSMPANAPGPGALPGLAGGQTPTSGVALPDRDNQLPE